MRNEILYDSHGVPDIMVAYTPDELGLPAELNGRKVAEYMIGKYPACMIDGVPHSLPFQRPAVNVDHDEAIRLCEAKGAGWHLVTNDEWVALSHQSKRKGVKVRGNTNCGKSHSNPEEHGTTYGEGGKTLTGSGPTTWNHDGTAEGVADMVGGIWEHVGGIRFLNGQVQVIPDNRAAAGADQSPDSPEWTAIYTEDGDPIYFNPHDGEIFIEPTEADDKDYDGVRFTELKTKGLDIPDKLIALGLYPEEGFDGTEYFWIDNDGERCVYRGGGWNNGAGAGLFYLSGDNSRTYVYWAVGFRPAFVRYSGNSGLSEDLDQEADDLSSATEAIKEQIKENADKLNARDSLLLSDSLPDLLRFYSVRALADMYEALGGEHRGKFMEVAYKANDDEFREAANLSLQFSQIATAAKMFKATAGIIDDLKGGHNHE